MLSRVERRSNPGEAANVQGVVRTSPDGSHVYFVAAGVLTTLPNANGQVAHTNAENLYVVDTGSGETKFIADLCSGTEQSGAQADLACPASPTTLDSSLWSLNKGQAQRPPDGRYLIFATVARHGALTADDTRPEGPAQVYRYDASGRRRAVFRYPGTRGRRTGVADLRLMQPSGGEAVAEAPLAGDAPGATPAHAPLLTRNLSEDGKRVFFNTL